MRAVYKHLIMVVLFGVTGICSSGALGILAGDYKEIRELALPDFGNAVTDRRTINGITNGGHVVGTYCIGCSHGNYDMLMRWMRNTGYEVEDLKGGGDCTRTFGGRHTPCGSHQVFDIGIENVQALDGGVVTEQLQTSVRDAVCDPPDKGMPDICKSVFFLSDEEGALATIGVDVAGQQWTVTYPDGVSKLQLKVGAESANITAVVPDRTGFVGMGIYDVTSGGLAYGRANIDNWHVFQYSFETNTVTDLHKGGRISEGTGGNNDGQVATHSNGTPYRIVDANDDPVGGKNFWFFHKAKDISDNDVVVGSDVFGGAAKIWRPTGEDKWAEMGTSLGRLSGASGNDDAFRISDDGRFASGSATDGSGKHGVIWDTATGEIVADFGPMSGTFYINGAGNAVVGSKTVFTPLPFQVPHVWSTTDDWASFNEINLEDLLNDLPTGFQWSQLNSARGINDSGQIVGVGTLADEDGLETEAFFLLDTLDLALLLRGDVNNDGSVNNLDITAFIGALAAADESSFLTQFPSGNYAAADTSGDEEINNLDITSFISILAGGADSATAAVPEPATWLVVAAGSAALLRRRR